MRLSAGKCSVGNLLLHRQPRGAPHGPLVERIDSLRGALRRVKRAHPFRIDAMVVLPDHLHAVWTMPRDDADFATRWMLIKAGFSRQVPPFEHPFPKSCRQGGAWYLATPLLGAPDSG